MKFNLDPCWVLVGILLVVCAGCAGEQFNRAQTACEEAGYPEVHMDAHFQYWCTHPLKGGPETIPAPIQ